MKDNKTLMSEASILYYEKNLTQQEIASIMNLSRQSVSKLLNDAVKERIIEFVIHNPHNDKKETEERIKSEFNIERVRICTVSANNDELRLLMAAKAAVEHIIPYINEGNKRIAVSWGKTIQLFINEMPVLSGKNNTVFPLFGATNHQQSYFLSNELARAFAEKINAEINYAWFPYKPENVNDCDLFKRTSYYKSMCENWSNIDIAVVGIGDPNALPFLRESFGAKMKEDVIVGDIATHTFDINGIFADTDTDADTLCVSVESLKNAKQVVGIAVGDNKVRSVAGALRTGILTDLITDEYTAEKVIELLKLS